MKKTDLAEALHKDAALETKKQAAEIVEWFFDTITKTLKKGEEVDIAGFARFYVEKRDARQGRNPSTGESMTIAAKKVVKIKQSSVLKNAVK